MVTRQVIDYATAASRDLPIIVRTHSRAERASLERRPRTVPIHAETALATEMCRRLLCVLEGDAERARRAT